MPKLTVDEIESMLNEEEDDFLDNIELRRKSLEEKKKIKNKKPKREYSDIDE